MSNFNTMQEAIRNLRERCDEWGLFTHLIPTDPNRKVGRSVPRTLWVMNDKGDTVKVNIRRSPIAPGKPYLYHVYNMGGEQVGSYEWPMEAIVEVRAILK